MITIITVGKKHESWIIAGIERFETRLKQPFNVKWELLPHSQFEGVKAREEESQRILGRLGKTDALVLLDEEGKNFSSPEINSVLEAQFSTARQVVIVIGGAYGVSDALKARADATWSLSRLVFPHQLVRLILVEQLYRAQTIGRGGKYHHE